MSRNQDYLLTYTPARTLPTRWKPPRVDLGSCMRQESEAFIAWASCLAPHAHLLSMQELTLSHPLSTHVTSPSLHSCNLPPLTYKRESRGPFQGTGSNFLLFPSLFSSEGSALSFFPSSTFSHPWLKIYRDLGPSSLSRPFVTPTTNQHK
jgi:hypothetical protein